MINERAFYNLKLITFYFKVSFLSLLKSTHFINRAI